MEVDVAGKIIYFYGPGGFHGFHGYVSHNQRVLIFSRATSLITAVQVIVPDNLCCSWPATNDDLTNATKSTSTGHDVSHVSHQVNNVRK